MLQDYRDRRFQVLVATDLAARGLDVPHIELVINYDMPQCPEDYIHRIGRTARAGASGKAVNLLTPTDGDKWKAIRRLMNPEARLVTNQVARGRASIVAAVTLAIAKSALTISQCVFIPVLAKTAAGERVDWMRFCI